MKFYKFNKRIFGRTTDPFSRRNYIVIKKNAKHHNYPEITEFLNMQRE